MKRALNEPVIVENVTGAAGTIGTARVARAVPDGYTTVLGHWQTHVVNGATFALPFDVVNDFEPISLIADCPIWLVGRNTVPAKNLAELVAWLKENPLGRTMATAGRLQGETGIQATATIKLTNFPKRIGAADCPAAWS